MLPRWGCSSLFPYTAITQLLHRSEIDWRLVMLYKVTYDLVAIPASDYLTPNRRQSRHIHSLAYRQIPTLKNYDKYTFFLRTIVHRNALPAFIPLLPTLAQSSNAVSGSAFAPPPPPPSIRFCFYLLTNLTKQIPFSNSFHPLCISFIQLTPFTTCYIGILSDVLLGC